MLGKHVRDPIFSQFTKLDWKYYAIHLSLDNEAEQEHEIEMADYLAMFSNYEAVRKVRTSRQQRKLAKEMGVEYSGDNTNKTIGMDDETFSRFIAQKLGKMPKFKK